METWKHGHIDMETGKHEEMETWRHGDMDTSYMDMETRRHQTENESPGDLP
jgi:hypothetical protein